MNRIAILFALLSVAAFAQNSNAAKTELEREAKKWKENPGSYKASKGKSFSFEANVDEGRFGDTWTWTATSNVKIDKCPAKSVWTMSLNEESTGKKNLSKQIPDFKLCGSVTPNVIAEYGDEWKTKKAVPITEFEDSTH
jgi:hypothetical protein